MQALFGMNNQSKSNESKKLPKLRTIKETMNELKALDKDTALSLYYIRTLCGENKVKHKTAGRKILIDFNDLLEYLNKGE